MFTDSSDQTLIDETTKLLGSEQNPSLLWVGEPNAKLENSSVAVIATFPKTNAGGQRYYRCTVDVKMANPFITTTRNLPKIVTGYNPDFKTGGTSNTSWSRIAVDPSWAQLLNPTLFDDVSNMAVFTHSIATARIWNNTQPTESYNYHFIVESILTLMVTNEVACSTYNNTLVGSLKGPNDPNDVWRGGTWQKYFLPRHGLGFNGPQFISEESDPVTSNHTMFAMYAYVNSYAWSAPGMIQRANIVALLAYIVLACAHIVYIIWTGSTSNARDSVPEIVALAAQSQSSRAMQNVGVGIETMDPLKQMVKVRNVDGHLEYIFADAYT